MKKQHPPPMSDDRFDEMVRDHEKHRAIPWRLASIERWAATEVLDEKDKARLLALVAAARREFDRGEFEIAVGSMRALESALGATKSRQTAPLLRIGRDVQEGGRKGAEIAHGPAEAKLERDSRLAAEFRAARRGGMSKGDAYAHVARRHRVSSKMVYRAVRAAEV